MVMHSLHCYCIVYECFLNKEKIRLFCFFVLYFHLLTDFSYNTQLYHDAVDRCMYVCICVTDIKFYIYTTKKRKKKRFPRDKSHFFFFFWFSFAFIGFNYVLSFIHFHIVFSFVVGIASITIYILILSLNFTYIHRLKCGFQEENFLFRFYFFVRSSTFLYYCNGKYLA